MPAVRDGSDTKILVKPRNRIKGTSEYLSQFSDRLISYLDLLGVILDDLVCR
jgi:hypothetical protein